MKLLYFFLFIILILIIMTMIPIYIKVIYDGKFSIYMYRYRIYPKNKEKPNQEMIQDAKKMIEKAKRKVEYKKYLYLLKTIKVKKVQIKTGYQTDDWFVNAMLFNLLYTIFPMTQVILKYYDIDFIFDIKHESINNLYFECIIKTKLCKIIYETLKKKRR